MPHGQRCCTEANVLCYLVQLARLRRWAAPWTSMARLARSSPQTAPSVRSCCTLTGLLSKTYCVCVESSSAMMGVISMSRFTS